MATKLGISVVIPLYNEQESLRELTAALRSQLFKLCGSRYQIIFVNDGSTDRSGDILRDILQVTSRVTVLSFRRNMGKSAALAVGFREVKCGIVITMDADLQDDPGEIPNLIAKLDEGYDLVSGWKKKRYDPITKTLPSKFFNSVTGFFAGVKLHDFNCGLKAYRKEVTDALDVYGELHRYLPALAHWKGFRVGEIPVVHHPRKFGKSKFGSSRFFKGFLDLLSIVFTNRYGKRPLHLFGTVGTLLALIGLGINITVTVEWAMNQTALSNRPILLLGILLILVGVQLISLGLLGEMVVKQTNRASDFTAIRERGSRLPEDQDRARRSTSGRMRSDRVSPDRLGRTDRPEGERMSREGRRPRNEGEEGSGGRRSDDAQRRMGRDRRRRPRP
jgi:glycosyltransferase involved in cell wall biosynthesis